MKIPVSSAKLLLKGKNNIDIIKNRIYCIFLNKLIMNIIISSLLVFFYLVVNVLALPLQNKHDPSVAWPTEEWSVNTDNFQPNSAFNNKINELFSDESYGRLGKTNSLLIVQNGEIVFEKYNQGINKDTKLVSWSMAKSYTAAIAGLMIDKGLISDVNEKNLLPNWTDLRKEITIVTLYSSMMSLVLIALDM